jgi:hypothetical protein
LVGAEKQTIKASEIKESSGTGENKIYLNFMLQKDIIFIGISIMDKGD